MLLIQLDTAVLEIVGKITVIRKDSRVPLILERAAADNDSRVLDGNVALQPAIRRSLFNQPSTVHEIRVLTQQAILEAIYQTKRLKDDSCFDLQGFVQQSDRDFKLNFLPVQEDNE